MSAPASVVSAVAAVPPRVARPELLAPAGDWECARAAVENGADAIYFGLERFNARMRAKNFTQADLPALMEFLHRRGVRGYVTFNTLVFTAELADAADYLRGIIAAGVDAAIVQDIGICRMIRELSPDFPIHCSTQMTISSAAGVQFARDLGAQLVVLARENSLAEIEKIKKSKSTDDAKNSAIAVQMARVEALRITFLGEFVNKSAIYLTFPEYLRIVHAYEAVKKGVGGSPGYLSWVANRYKELKEHTQGCVPDQFLQF